MAQYGISVIQILFLPLVASSGAAGTLVALVFAKKCAEQSLIFAAPVFSVIGIRLSAALMAVIA